MIFQRLMDWKSWCCVSALRRGHANLHCAGAMLIFAVWVGPFPTSPALGAIVRGGGRRPIVNYNLRLAQPLLTGPLGQTRMKLKYLELIGFVFSVGRVAERATKRQGCAHSNQSGVTTGPRAHGGVVHRPHNQSSEINAK